MLLRIVAIPAGKQSDPNDCQAPEEYKGPAPRHVSQHRHDEQRRKGRTPTCRRPQIALRLRTLQWWKPRTEGFRDQRKAARVPHPEQKLDTHHGDETPRSTGKSSEDRPCRDNAEQAFARTHAISIPCAGHLEERITGEERGEHASHLCLAQMEIL